MCDDVITWGRLEITCQHGRSQLLENQEVCIIIIIIIIYFGILFIYYAGRIAVVHNIIVIKVNQTLYC